MADGTRRPPLDDRELCRLLEVGYGQSEAAREMGYPVGTVTGKVKKLRARGVVSGEPSGYVIDWEALDQWEQGHRSPAHAMKDEPHAREAEGKTQVLPNVLPKAFPLDPQELQALKKIIEWWENTPGSTRVVPNVIPKGSTPKTRRSFWISDNLYERLKALAAERNVSMADLVNAALRSFVSGDSGRTEGR